jgi:hypothetical protein
MLDKGPKRRKSDHSLANGPVRNSGGKILALGRTSYLEREEHEARRQATKNLISATVVGLGMGMTCAALVVAMAYQIQMSFPIVAIVIIGLVSLLLLHVRRQGHDDPKR